MIPCQQHVYGGPGTVDNYHAYGLFCSIGFDWYCRFDNSEDLFAIKKITEVLHRSDSGAGSQERLRNEFNVYLTMEEAYQSGRLRERIAPRCYAAFVGRFSSLNYAMVF